MTETIDDFLRENGEEIAIPDAAQSLHRPNGNGRAHSFEPIITSAASLRKKTFAPLHYVVPGYVPEGLTLFAGRPKIGKSWWLLTASAAVAGGQPWWGSEPSEPVDVLYLALEDNERRLQSRLTKLLPSSDDWPPRLALATEWPRANEGGLDHIRRWIEKTAKPRLVVVDVLAMLRAPRAGSQEPYESDYQAIKGLQQIALDHRIAVVASHHLRKLGAESDPFEKVSGTLGLSGAADTVLILDRDSNGTTLYGRGRDIPEIEKAVRFDHSTCQWQLLGEADAVRRTSERSAILSVLSNASEPMPPSEIAACAGMDTNNVHQLLFKMVISGEVSKAGRARYVLPSRIDADVDPR